MSDPKLTNGSRLLLKSNPFVWKNRNVEIVTSVQLQWQNSCNSSNSEDTVFYDIPIQGKIKKNSDMY